MKTLIFLFITVFVIADNINLDKSILYKDIYRATDKIKEVYLSSNDHIIVDFYKSTCLDKDECFFGEMPVSKYNTMYSQGISCEDNSKAFEVIAYRSINKKLSIAHYDACKDQISYVEYPSLEEKYFNEKLIKE